ncbi:PfkB family carbohydrate kinase [soil metagenome]
MAALSMVCIGKATEDVFLRSATLFEPHWERGRPYEEFPWGRKLDVEEAVFTTGGNVANAATTFARQGLQSTFIWTLGTELTSRIIVEALADDGIDVSHVGRDEALTASYSTILLSSSGERTILNYRGRRPAGHGTDLDLRPLASADWVYLSSLADMGLLERVISTAAEAGARVMLNPAGIELTETTALLALLDRVDVLAVNREEAQQLFGGDTLEGLARSAAARCPVVIVSDGPSGALTTDGVTIVESGLYEDAPVVDRTGCGDAFASGFLSQWAQGKSLRESVVFASANSTSVVQQVGAKAGILRAGVVLHDMPIVERAF